jgi:hypothetical protein
MIEYANIKLVDNNTGNVLKTYQSNRIPDKAELIFSPDGTNETKKFVVIEINHDARNIVEGYIDVTILLKEIV